MLIIAAIVIFGYRRRLHTLKAANASLESPKTCETIANPTWSHPEHPGVTVTPTPTQPTSDEILTSASYNTQPPISFPNQQYLDVTSDTESDNYATLSSTNASQNTDRDDVPMTTTLSETATIDDKVLTSASDNTQLPVAYSNPQYIEATDTKSDNYMYSTSDPWSENTGRPSNGNYESSYYSLLQGEDAQNNQAKVNYSQLQELEI